MAEQNVVYSPSLCAITESEPARKQRACKGSFDSQLRLNKVVSFSLVSVWEMAL